MFFLAQIHYSPENVAAIQGIKEEWDPIWNSVLNSFVFDRLVDLGLTIAGVSIAIWAIRTFRMLVDGQFVAGFSQVIYPTLVVILLSNNGFVLKNLTLYQRSVVNYVNDTVLESMNVTLTAGPGSGQTYNISQIAGSAVVYQEAKNRLMSEFNRCTQIAGEEKNRCFNRVFNDYEPGVVYQAASQARKPFTIQEAVAYGQVYDQLNEAYQELKDKPDEKWKEWWYGIANTPAMKLLRGGDLVEIIYSVIADILTIVQLAVANLFELCMLLTALLGPIALGGSLVTGGGTPLGPLLGWMVGFWSIGIARVCLTLAQGMGLMVYAVKGPSFMGPLGIIMAILAPLISFALASGGGLAVFSSILSAGSSVASVASNLMSR